MTKTEQALHEWLNNPKRKYADGLVLFNTLATPTQRKNYGQFLNAARPENITPFSTETGVLINKLVQIRQMMKVNPDLFRDADIITVKTDVKENQQVAVSKIVDQKDLPKKLQKRYERNREITPLMASLHSEIASENTTVEKRKKLVTELCALDDERRANWDLIDDWASGKDVSVEEEDTKPGFAADPVLAGMQIARRIERLKENIKRSQATAEDDKKSELIRNNAAKRVKAYQAELAELEQWEPKKAGADVE